VKVLYIAGYSRSGSTLLLRLLGETPGVAAVGELFDLWQRSFVDNQLCGCGEPFLGCSFWRDVARTAFGCEPAEVPAGRLALQRLRVQGHGAIPKLWVPPLQSRRFKNDAENYRRVLERVYGAIASVSGASIVVDSSKVPQYQWVLAGAVGIELHVVHLVRDSRATAHSLERRKLRPEIHWRRQEMDRLGALRSALEWQLSHVMIATRKRSAASYIRVRYEDLVRDPAAVLKQIGVACNFALREPPGLAEGKVVLPASHTVSGNPSRFIVGPTDIAPDDEWVDRMSARDRATVTALTAPGLRHYGYRLAPPVVGGTRSSALNLSQEP